MVRTLDDALASLTADERAAVDVRYDELMTEMSALKELRRDLRASQKVVAERLGSSQPAVSKLEGEADMLLSTLRGYIEALGGELDLVVRLEGRPPVRISGIRDLHDDLPSAAE